ncbi:MAG TPA: hypothetical protein QF571_01240 [Desulfobacterales bacterium]|nr:hypothetical protein [Desulfobacterales bacterium]HJO61431.1 hypothetical protein [Desulfobacterales bacterium]
MYPRWSGDREGFKQVAVTILADKLGVMSEKFGFASRPFVSANWVRAGGSVPSKLHGILSVFNPQPMGA